MSSILGVQLSDSRSEFSRPSSYIGHQRYSPSGNPHGQTRDTWFEGGLPTPPRTKEMTGISVSRNYPDHATQQAYTNGYSNVHTSTKHSRVPSESYVAKTIPKAIAQDAGSTEQPRGFNTIAAHLQIPESVNSSKGSIAEFASEITCLFWFESATTLQYAEGLPFDTPSNRGLVPDAVPSLGFRKWVTTMLSTTQVGQNVILLALMFVYRLKKFNPSVSGKRGSEFRLLTIALMLGNKFLDDNTYTNKTWAEVSGISVQEIHIMEVEFLSNMRYELYASQSDWHQWKTLLGKFGAFYEKASRHQRQSSPNINPPITPTNQAFNYKLPSPQSKHSGSLQISPTALPNPLASLPQLPPSPIRKQNMSTVPYERKRSVDGIEHLPPAKRIQYAATLENRRPSVLTHSTTPDLGPLLNSDPLALTRIPQLPMPNIGTGGSTGTAPMTTTNPPPVTNYLAPISLPPTRAMASVFPATASAWTQPIAPHSALTTNLNGVQLPAATSSFTVDHGRSHSAASSAHTSPVNLYTASTPTRAGLSPSYFLTNRSSPYRPVRNVHTLLNPPPSAAMQNPVRNIGFDQMHYQPLGRPVTDRRPGPVPYHFSDSRQQSAVSTPTGVHHRLF